MLREVLEDALQRGERLKKDIVGQLLSSAAFNDLLGNKRFTETVARVIQTKHEVTRVLKQNVQDVLKMMSIPSREQISSYEKRVKRLEQEIDHLGRQIMRQRLSTRTNRRKK